MGDLLGRGSRPASTGRRLAVYGAGTPPRKAPSRRASLPKPVREALGLEEGDQVVFRVEGDRAVLAPTAHLLELAGSVAEVVDVLESFYEVPRARVAELVRAVLAFPAIVVLDPTMLLRALEVHETARLDFAESYLVARAERSGVGVVALFDRAIDRVGTVRRLEPA